MKKIILIILTIFALVNTSCEKDEKITIPESEFKIPIIEIDLSGDYKIGNFKARLSQPFWANYCYLMYSYDSMDHHYNNTFLEIEFYRLFFASQWYKPGFCRIGCNNNNKSFVIIWFNKGVQKKSNNFGILSYSTDIDETTDTIYTTLKKKTVIESYPKFKGVYKYLNIDKIILDYYWSPKSYAFYNNIKIGNFKFGMIMPEALLYNGPKL